MICQQCKDAKATSKVHAGSSMITNAGYSAYYDEKGHHHRHDSNITTTDYTCSNGHSWQVKTSEKCWCGWPDKA